MTRLRWEDGTSRHRRHLQGFVCCDPEKPDWRRPEEHGELWAYRVQQAVRSREALPSPCRPPRYLALGFDGRGLAAVVHYHVLGGDFFLSLVGVAQRCRRAGGVVADEAMTLMMDRVTAYGVENGLESVWISGNVDRENRASKAMLARHGWVHEGWLDGQYETWGRDVEVGGVEAS